MNKEFQVPSSILCSSLSMPEKLVWIYLNKVHNVSFRNIAYDLGLSERTVLKCVKKLESQGILEVTREETKREGHIENQYKTKEPRK